MEVDYFYSFGCLHFVTLIFYPRTASTMAAITLLLVFFHYYSVAGSSASTGEKTVACLSVPTCFVLGAFTLLKYESAGTGVADENAGTNISGFSYNAALGMLFLDIWFYILIGLYFNEGLTSEWGSQRPWYFLFTRSFWCPQQADANDAAAAARLTTQYDHSNPVHCSEVELQSSGSYSEPLVITLSLSQLSLLVGQE
jgi:hypothetical protein